MYKGKCDWCGVVSGSLSMGACSYCIKRIDEYADNIDRARQRIATGHYERVEVLDAVAEIIEDHLRKEGL